MTPAAEQPGPALRVGMVCPYSLSVPGGVQAQVMGLARELRRRGVEVRVLAPCDGPPPATFVTPLGNSLPTSANGSIAPLAPDAPAALRTMRALLDEQFDVLHVHEPFAPGATVTAVVLHVSPIVATFHAAGDSAGYRYLSGLIRRSAENIDERVVVSKDARALVEGYIGGEYTVLFNGVDIETFASAEPWPTSGPTIFFCGRHEERKGLDVLIDAMGRLGPDVRLWIGSSGPDTERLRALTRSDPRIEWLGRLSDAEKASRLRGADVFCAPSLHGESFGVVLVEAMAAGTAVVASSLDGYRNVATDGVDAVLVEPGDAAALAAALEQVLTDRPLAETLVAAGTRRARDFSMVTLADRYVEIYTRLARATAGPGEWLSLRPPSPLRGWRARMMARVRRPERVRSE